MPFKNQPLEFYDINDEDYGYRDQPFVIGDCLIEFGDRDRVIVQDKCSGKYLGTFFDVSDAIPFAESREGIEP